MSEVICPWCREWIEIPAAVVIAGNRCRCPKCWSVFYIVSEHPLHVQQESPAPLRATAGEGA